MRRSNVAGTALMMGMALVLSACGGDDATEQAETTKTADTAATSEPAAAETEESTAEPVAEETSEPAPTTSATADSEAKAMDVEQIAKGDYSSIEGTWTSPEGGTLEISGKKIVWRTSDDDQFATLTGLELSQNGQPARTAKATPEGGGVQIAAQWDEGGFPQGTALGFYPADVSNATILGLDVPSGGGDDRIVALPGNAAGRFLPTDLTPFVAKRSDDGSEGQESTGDSTADAAGECEPPVEGAFDCAGGPLPDGAKKVSAVNSSYGSHTASIITPTGNLGCDIWDDGSGPATMACEARSWQTDGGPVEPVGGDPEVGRPILNFDDGSKKPVYGGSKGDPFCFMEGACPTESGAVFKPQVVEYGEVVHYAGFACASEFDGMTCWNVDSGHGAFFSRSVLRTF